MEYRDAFLGRFEALIEAQDLSGDAADLADLVARILKPFEGGRIRVEPGPPVAISSSKVVPVALMLHELMTNAAKYGALSTPFGIVDVGWRLDAKAAGMVHLRWREHGGPSVGRPAREGFGSRLLQFSARELEGTADLRFEPAGLNATLSIPLS